MTKPDISTWKKMYFNGNVKLCNAGSISWLGVCSVRPEHMTRPRTNAEAAHEPFVTAESIKLVSPVEEMLAFLSGVTSVDDPEGIKQPNS